MRKLTAAVTVGALALSLSGCMYQIKLDPMDSDASVYVNGVHKGKGTVDYYVDGKYGYPQEFGVKVEPSTGKTYTMRIAREHDMPRAVITTAVSAGLGIANLIYDAQYGTVSLSSLVLLANAPLSWLTSYHYKAYYDLSKEVEKK